MTRKFHHKVNPVLELTEREKLVIKLRDESHLTWGMIGKIIRRRGNVASNTYIRAHAKLEDLGLRQSTN